MDQLDLLKKDWKKQNEKLPQLSFDELSKITHKKSSSIVKWILIISVLELVIPNLIAFLSGSGNGLSLKLGEEYDVAGLQTKIDIFYGFIYVVAAYFVFSFYKNYKNISATSNTKDLMKNIIKTRKTVKYYIWFSLSMIPVIMGIISYNLFQSQQFIVSLPESVTVMHFWIIVIIITIFMVLLMGAIYMLVYGLLLRKLNKNYNELLQNEKEL